MAALGIIERSITAALLPRLLDAVSYGRLSAAQAVAQCLWPIVELGTGMYGVRTVAQARDQPDEVVSNLVSMRLACGFVVATVYTGVVTLLPLPWGERLLYVVCGGSAVSMALFTPWVLRGLELFHLIAVGALVSISVYLVALAALSPLGLGPTTAATAWVASLLANSLTLLCLVRWRANVHVTVAWRPKEWRLHANQSIGFAAATLLLLLYQWTPLLLLRVGASEHEVGVFAAPYRLVLMIFSSASMIAPMSFYPVLSELYSIDRPRFGKTARRLVGLALAMGFATAALGWASSGFVADLIFGEDYPESDRLLQLLFLLAPVLFARESLRVVLMASHRVRRLHFAAGGALVTALVVGASSMDRAGALGAAAGFAAGEIVLASALFASAFPAMFPARSRRPDVRPRR